MMAQRGVFLCPGDISVSFEKNLRGLRGWESRKNVLRLELSFSRKERSAALLDLHNMGVDYNAHFPDTRNGVALTVRTRMPLYEKQLKIRRHEGNSKRGLPSL